MPSAYCKPCDRAFVTQLALLQHLANSARHEGEYRQRSDYESSIYGDDDSSQSQQTSYDDDDEDDGCAENDSRGGHDCAFCSYYDAYAEDYDDHMHNHHALSACCEMWFESDWELEQHDSADDYECGTCYKTFHSCSSVQQHLASPAHATADYACPGCPHMYTSPSGVIQHLESGACRGRITRAVIDNYVAARDRDGVITHPSKLITSGPPENLRIAPSYPTYMATQKAWDARAQAYKCYFCPAKFARLNQLDQHLNSPRHSKRESKMYRCPGRGCGAETETMSGLVQHVESGKCGVRENRMVQDTMDAFTGRLGLLTL